ncbi:MAG: urease accessory protein UreF [Burkholderiales bacterium]|nr:urease accessory protein UreF [Burkholderiales bacterium]
MKPGLALAAAQSTQAAAAQPGAATPSLSPVALPAPASPSPNALTRLLHLASTMLPVGAFSYSQGLEWAVECGTVTGRADAERWIVDCLRWSVGRFEAPLLVAAHRAWAAGDDAQARALDDWMRATRETRELLAETLQMGYSLRRWCDDAGALDTAWLARIGRLDSPTYPVLFAAIAAAWGLDVRTMATVYLWSWLENQVGAALKAVPLGQTDGQRILLAAGPAVDAVADDAIARAVATGPEGWTTQCPGLAIASSCHEAQYSRLFRS